MRLSWLTFAKKPTPSQEVFSRIYKNNEWIFGSGEGSLPSSTEVYRRFLQQFLKDRQIRSVVDVGCGDWQFSHLLDWSGVEYTGIDVVADVIANNALYYTQPNIHFYCQDVLHTLPPHADLLLLKDVLQHWSFEAIDNVLPLFARYRYVLITNDEATEDNVDILMGSYRPLDLRKAPFHIPMTEVLRFGGARDVHGNPWTKVTLLLES